MGKDILKNISDILCDILPSLEPASCQPSDYNEYQFVNFDRTEKDNSKWKKLISENISTAKTFEIHCWEDETDEISMALKYGVINETSWKLGSVIKGNITDDFKSMLLSLPKPSDTDTYNKMTPFFSIFFDNGFSSEHYGTENHIRRNYE